MNKTEGVGGVAENKSDVVKPPPVTGQGVQNLSRGQKYVVSVVLFYCTFAFGCSLTFLSSTIIDFKNKFHSSVQEVSIVFTVLTASYLIGALICGVIYKFANRQIVVTCLIFCMSAALLSMPHVPSITHFFLLSALLGFGAGGYDTAQTSWLIDIWRQASPPFIFGQRFFYSLGTVVPPLLLGPFLTEDDDDTDDDKNGNHGNGTQDLDTMAINVMAPNKEFKLAIPFTVVGCLLALAVLIQIIMFFKLKASSSSPAEDVQIEEKMAENEQNIEKKAGEIISRSKKIILILLTCAAVGAYVGLELTLVQFLPTYAFYSGLGMSKAECAQLLFGMTLSFCISRLLGIFIVLKVPSHLILCANYALLIGGNLILLLFAQNSRLMLWIGCVAMGAGLSTVYGSSFAFIQKYLVVTETIASIVTVCGGLAAAGYPLIVGQFVEHDPVVLCHVNFFSIVVSMTAFGVMFWITMFRKKETK